MSAPPLLPTGQPALLLWLQSCFQTSATLSLTPLVGGLSSTVLAVHSRQGHRGVVRLFDQRDWLAREPDLVAHEAAALHTAQACQVPVPQCLGTCPPAQAAALGLPAPALLMSHLPGEVTLPPPPHSAWIQALAQTLAAIHALTPTHKAATLAWHFGSWADPEAQIPTWSRRPRLWQKALKRWRLAPPPFEPVFLHRDYHPTNLLWQHGRVSGVVDWVNACWGPAGVDVAHCRVNLTLLWGLPAARAFLDAYCQARPSFGYEVYWELDALINALPAPSFYSPWADWGIPPFADACAQQGLEELLEEVLAL
ncbi:MAG: phosphotransferase family protein [Candidatus Sericytochromatia bacterium]